MVRERSMLVDRPGRALAAKVSVLALILLVAVWFRTSGRNWDEGQHINVDELAITKVILKRVNIPPGTSLKTILDPQKSPINPRAGGAYFVYGALPLYLDKLASSAAAAFTGDKYFNGLDGIEQTGRLLASLFDTLTTLLVFATGMRLWGFRQGLVASAFYALAILPIQTSHFFISDPFMATFMAATLLCSVLFYKTQRVRFVLLAGLGTGLAMACKLSAFPVIVLPLLVILMRKTWRGDDTLSGLTWRRVVGLVGLIIGTAFIGLFMGDPFAVLDAPTYLKQLGMEAQIQGGIIDEWYTRKYVGTWPVVHQLMQLILLGAGPLIGLAGVAGCGIAMRRVWRDRDWIASLLLVGATIYLVAISLLETKWVRYLLPLVPYLCLFASAFGFWVYSYFQKRRLGQLPRSAVIVALLFSTLLGSLAINSVFISEHTQLKASRWVYANIPFGSRIGIEKTATLMPLSLPGHKEPETEYTLVEMDPLSDMPTKDVADTLRAKLHEVDYLIIDATQAAATVAHLPWRYPAQIRYYELLLNGRLGFSVALHSTSYPRLAGLQIADEQGWLDVSFTTSSHPPIWVLKKERELGDEEWSGLFAEAIQHTSLASRRGP
jgi:hypothetical protein